jgi:hypothetical protein
MDLRIIINLLGFKLDGSHLNILSNKTGKKKNMDAEGQNRECDRFTPKGMEKKKQFFLGLFFYCINFVF